MSESKQCFKCKEVKPLSEFYKHSGMADGHVNKCKSCNRRDVTENRNKNIERIRQYDRERSKSPEHIKAAAEHSKLWRAADKRRMAAHNAVARALRSGSLVRQPCERCGNAKSLAHHEDYDKKLDVVWLCEPCHRQRHKEINTLEV